MGKNLSVSAKDKGSIPGPERFHMPWSNKVHVPQPLGPQARTTEACMPRPCALQREGHAPTQRTAPVHCN